MKEAPQWKEGSKEDGRKLEMEESMSSKEGEGAGLGKRRGH